MKYNFFALISCLLPLLVVASGPKVEVADEDESLEISSDEDAAKMVQERLEAIELLRNEVELLREMFLFHCESHFRHAVATVPQKNWKKQ